MQVQRTAGQPVTTVRTIPGLDATGDGGLLDLAISPTYAEDHLIYAYVTTATDNRVIDFTLDRPDHPRLHRHSESRLPATPAASRSTRTATC